MKPGKSDNHGNFQSNHDIERPDDASMDLNRARQTFNLEKNSQILSFTRLSIMWASISLRYYLIFKNSLTFFCLFDL